MFYNLFIFEVIYRFFIIYLSMRYFALFVVYLWCKDKGFCRKSHKIIIEKYRKSHFFGYFVENRTFISIFIYSMIRFSPIHFYSFRIF